MSRKQLGLIRAHELQPSQADRGWARHEALRYAGLVPDEESDE